MSNQLDQAYGHEKLLASRTWLTQPMGEGVVREFTWAEGLAEARRMAAHLRSLNLPEKSHVALFSKNTAWWILADLAIWMAGHVSVPLYPTLAAHTIREILVHSDAKLVLIGKLDGFEEMLRGIPDALPKIAMPLSPNVDAPQWADIVKKAEPMRESPTRPMSDLATIIYTSGSTGAPKGVMHAFQSMTQGMDFGRTLKMSPDDRMLSYLPLAHVAERLLVETATFNVGHNIFFAESLDTFLSDLRRARPTLFFSVPRLWQRFQQGVFAKMPPEKIALYLKIPIVRGIVRKKILRGLGLDHVRYAGSGSAPISAELLSWYRSLGLDLLEGYGMTENFCISHITRPGESRPGYVGRLYEGAEQRFTPEGELLVKSPGTMLGYYKADALTKEVLDPDGFLHTGDRGEVDERGALKITGRVKELFKSSKGKYIAPAPIENKLMDHRDVEQAIVSGANMPQPFGVVVLSDAAKEIAREDLARSLDAQMKAINATLSPHEHLEKIVIASEPWTIENGLLTPTLKLKRGAIESRYEARVEDWYKERDTVLWE